MRRFRPFLFWIFLCLGACQGVANGPGPALPSTGINSTPPDSTATATPTPTPAPIRARFFSFGDWGTGTPSQIAVADAVAADCQAKGCDFGLLLGDNFYDVGVVGSSRVDLQACKLEYSIVSPK